MTEAQSNFRRPSTFAGMQMKQMVKNALGPTAPQVQGPSTLDPKESQRNWNITARLNSKNFQGWLVRWMTLPGDIGDARNSPQQQARNKEWFRQSAMPWGNMFMVTPTDANRFDNGQMQSFVSQRQRPVPNTYGQFYAFMHALSAAFGNLGGQ